MMIDATKLGGNLWQDCKPAKEDIAFQTKLFTILFGLVSYRNVQLFIGCVGHIHVSKKKFFEHYSTAGQKKIGRKTQKSLFWPYSWYGKAKKKFKKGRY